MAEIIKNNQVTLTVVVVDDQSHPAAGAQVSITPSDNSGVTNSAGEIQFKLGDATKYEITASANGKTVTVPYYVTKDGATRLIVNPVHVKNVEAQLHQSSLFGSSAAANIGIVLGIVVVLVILWKLLRRRA